MHNPKLPNIQTVLLPTVVFGNLGNLGNTSCKGPLESIVPGIINETLGPGCVEIFKCWESKV